MNTVMFITMVVLVCVCIFVCWAFGLYPMKVIWTKAKHNGHSIDKSSFLFLGLLFVLSASIMIMAIRIMYYIVFHGCIPN